MNASLYVFPVIHLDQTAYLYDVMYKLAFIIGFIYLTIDGYKKKFDFSTWLLLITSLFVGLILGSRLGVNGFSDFKDAILLHKNLNFSGKSAIGAFILGFLFFFSTKKYLKFNRSILPSIAFMLPLMIVIQRVGCLYAGCCYGNITDLLWGIRYNQAGQIFQYQVDHHIISSQADYTYPVHPVPIYLILSSLLSIFILIYYRNKLKNKSSLFFLSLVLIFFGRFVIEFFRNPITNHNIQGNSLAGLKIVQWFLLAGVIIFSILFQVNEKSKKTILVPIDIQPIRGVTTVIFLLIILYFSRSIFDQSEYFILNLLLLFNAVTLFIKLYSINSQYFRWVPASVICISFFMMSQTNIENKQIKTISINGNFQNINNTYYPCSKIQSGCLGYYCSESDTTKPIGPKYNGFNIGYDYLGLPNSKKRRFNIGINLQTDNYVNKINNKIYMNIHPYIGYKGKLISMRGGFHIGSIFTNTVKLGSTSTFLPSFRFQIGQENHSPVSIRFSFYDDELFYATQSTSSAYLQFHPKYLDSKLFNSIGVGYSNYINNTGGSVLYCNVDMNMYKNLSANFFFGGIAVFTDKGQKDGNTFGLGLKYKIYSDKQDEVETLNQNK